MRKIILLLLLATSVRSYSAVCTPVSGVGCDVPTSVVCTPSGSDSSKATCTFNTVLASDSKIQVTDALNQPAQTWYDSTMCVPSGGVCPHTIQLTMLPSYINVNAPYGGVQHYYAEACTHATFLPHTECPDSSQDVSSNGPPSRYPGTLPSFHTINRPAGTLSMWSLAQSPSNVFPGQGFVIATRMGAGIGEFGTSGSPSTMVNWMILHDVTIEQVGVGTTQCGTHNVQTTPIALDYWAFGSGSFNDVCANWTIIPENGSSNGWTPGNPLGINHPAVVTGTPANLATNNQQGYFIVWSGSDWYIFLQPSASVTPGNYIIHYQMQPILWDGTGNQTSTGPLLSQNQTLAVPITVLASAPLANNPPGSFPAWSFQPEFLQMAAYWGTWVCSNITDERTGSGPMALQYNSGVYEDENFTAANWTSTAKAWTYDGTRHFFAMGDLLFATTHPTWQATHTYTIGDMITVSGVTYMMNAVNGLNTPGLTGPSGPGPSPPSFNTGAGQTTVDNLLQWMSVANADYWRGCASKAQNGYRDSVLTAQGTNLAEYTMYATGIAMTFFRTMDAVAGNETGHSYTEINQRFGTSTAGTCGTTSYPNGGLCGITSGFSVSTDCITGNSTTDTLSLLTEIGTSSYWTGGSRMALCYGSSDKSFWGNITNSNNIYASRVKALQLQENEAYWAIKQDPNWINSPTGGARTLRMVDTSMAIMDEFQHIPSSQIVMTASAGSIFGFYSTIGQNAESLLHHYLNTLYYSDPVKFPCNGTKDYGSGVYGPTNCVVPDERIPQAIKIAADWAWLNEYDIEFDKNEVLADACSLPPLSKPQCQGSRRLHSYTNRYLRWYIVDHTVQNTFNTESSSDGEVGWMYSWLWARDSTMVPPSNGRITVTNYRDIALNMYQHAWDGRGCVAVSGTTPGTCTSWGVADYVNGGKGSGVGYNQLVTNPKQPQQTAYNISSEGLPWSTGTFTSNQGVLSLSTNPCWITGNRNADGSCNAASPLTDVMAPYPMNFYFSTGRPGNIVPTICKPGLTGNANTSICVQGHITMADGSGGFGSNNVAMNVGSYIGGTISNTTAIFNFMTVKNATCYLVVGPISGGAVEPAHVIGGGSPNTYPDDISPALAGGTPLPLWYHRITATGLTPTTTYHFGLYCTDDASNPPDPATCTANADHCFNMPYQVGGSTGKFSLSGGGTAQALTFTTTALPTGADLVVWPGVTRNPGTLIK
jgi:hypothetical protein